LPAFSANSGGSACLSQIEETKNTGKFTWGQPVKWHEIGPYTLLEYHQHDYDAFSGTSGKFSKEVSFHGWIEGKDTHESWPSLETGIIGLIARKYVGLNNNRIAYVFCRGIQAPPYDKKEGE